MRSIVSALRSISADVTDGVEIESLLVSGDSGLVMVLAFDWEDEAVMRLLACYERLESALRDLQAVRF